MQDAQNSENLQEDHDRVFRNPDDARNYVLRELVGKAFDILEMNLSSEDAEIRAAAVSKILEAAEITGKKAASVGQANFNLPPMEPAALAALLSGLSQVAGMRIVTPEKEKLSEITHPTAIPAPSFTTSAATNASDGRGTR